MNLTKNKSPLLISIVLGLCALMLVLPSNADSRLRSRAVSEDIDDGDYLTDFLESEECSSFFESAEAKLESLLEFDDDEITEYVCNAVHRKEISDTAGTIRDDILLGIGDEMSSPPLSCKRAFEMKYLGGGDMDNAQNIMSSYDACVEEMAREVDTIHGHRRALKEARDIGDASAYLRLLKDIILSVFITSDGKINNVLYFIVIG